ncbi:hypothetical protein FRC10_012189 [Ceratobasidium sp. 414]|nr:hypothetical protein FRC10_012189 [Ceratobasidium sp. 414]
MPEKYLTAVSYWQDPLFNIEEAGARPSWHSLTVSQHLSVELVKTIVSDQKKPLGLPDLMSEFGKNLLTGWQAACAVAPSHVLCPAEATPSSKKARHATIGYTERRQTAHNTVSDWCGCAPLLLLLCRFGGCLIRFCLRLDEDAWLKLEVMQMVEQRGRMVERAE